MNIAAAALIQQLIEEVDYFKKAELVDMLRRQECLSVKEIAGKIDKHPSYVSHLNRLLKLPPLVIDGYYSGQVSLSHLVILSRLKDAEKMEQVYHDILAKGLTSQLTEELIRLENFDITTEPEKVPPSELDALVAEVKEKLGGADIKVVQTRIKGKVVIELKGNNKQTTEFLRQVLLALSSQARMQGNSVEELMILE
ncbi:hypothetical protein BH09PAT2_BH09PAT2_09200 [soil metagenome]